MNREEQLKIWILEIEKQLETEHNWGKIMRLTKEVREYEEELEEIKNE